MPKILICGPIAPPVGGVSIHIERLTRNLRPLGYEFTLCDESRYMKPGIFNLRYLDFVEYIKLCMAADIVHIHSGPNLLRLFHLICARLLFRKAVITIHSWPVGSAGNSILAAVFGILSHRVIYVSEEIREQFYCKGQVLPAFIPPAKADEPVLPVEIEKWVKDNRAAGKKIVCSNAFRLETHNNSDLYGLDLCIEAIGDPQVHSRSAMVFVISDPDTHKERIAKYKRIIEERKLKDSIFLWQGFVSFTNLLDICDISVRATSTDGDSLSVRESLYLNKTTIASDVVKRPEGVILFTNRDAGSLIQALNIAWEISEPSERFHPLGSNFSTVVAIQEMYQFFWKKHRHLRGRTRHEPY
jgi:glycosyltransferase involved in cell wall biosynthesis